MGNMHDLQKPQYHFVMGPEPHQQALDPNYAIFWKGKYHLFYLCAKGAEHISSPDLIQWTRHSVILAIEPNDPEKGLLSGNMLN